MGCGQPGVTLGFALQFVFGSAVAQVIVKELQDDLLQGKAVGSMGSCMSASAPSGKY